MNKLFRLVNQDAFAKFTFFDWNGVKIFMFWTQFPQSCTRWIICRVRPVLWFPNLFLDHVVWLPYRHSSITCRYFQRLKLRFLILYFRIKFKMGWYRSYSLMIILILIVIWQLRRLSGMASFVIFRLSIHISPSVIVIIYKIIRAAAYFLSH